ncbi:maleylpyruvate isomerase N-terminal domain-containing protein (plasmid) [Streptomyces sp. BI20]|uniref:maleylpyruvate isomerase N-terminal domain-containing protein n=1 Tax=Streptomyces sp. BI20 TaxID=3403460 RepID=UPI003C7961C6
MDLFAHTWAALRAAVAALSDADFARPSGCAGWLVRDLACHLVIDAQDVLITLATPVDAAPTHNAADYWRPAPQPPGTAPGEDPLAALTVRLAAAYGQPALLLHHLDDVGAAAGRAAALADPDGRVGTQGFVLTVRDYLDAYVLEWTLHHLDLIAHLPTLPPPDPAGPRRSRALLEEVLGAPLPSSLPDVDALLLATGRRAPTPPETEALTPLADRLPLRLG